MKLPCPGNCNGRGVCGAETPGACKCEAGFAGPACEQSVPCASGCNNHGKCDPTSGKCACDAGWSGGECEHRTCPAGEHGEAPCAGRGRCLAGVCECEGSGVLASRDPTVASACRAVGRCMHNCNGHGACNATRGACACEDGWQGEWCQHQACAHSCGAHGVCVHGACSCDPGWDGDACEAQQCVGLGGRGCGEHGECMQPEIESELATCHCHRGWAGADCSVPTPPPTAEMYSPAPPPSPPP